MLYTFVYFVHQYLVLCSGNVSLEELIDNSIDVLYSSKLLTFCDLLSRTIQSYIEYQNHVIMYNVGSSGWHLHSRSCELNGYCIRVYWGLVFSGGWLSGPKWKRKNMGAIFTPVNRAKSKNRPKLKFNLCGRSRSLSRRLI